jgi:hypothetical protein
MHLEAKLIRLIEASGDVQEGSRQAAGTEAPAAQQQSQEMELSHGTDLKRATPQDSQQLESSRGTDSNQALSQQSQEAEPSRGTDLKQALLQLLEAAREVGESVNVPAARAALSGIETLQAANVLASEQGQPYLLQIPFPDGSVWKTLHLSVEPEGRNQASAQEGGSFRVLMHIPLRDLGETWIDARMNGNDLRAVFYLNSGAGDRVRSNISELRSELQADGFGEVLLDVRPTSALPEHQRRQTAAMRVGRPPSGSVLDVSA